MTARMFLYSWRDIGRVVVVSTLVFVPVVAILRFVGQQALAQMSSYDVIVTAMRGSIIGAARGGLARSAK